jgi:hypothetical protein
MQKVFSLLSPVACSGLSFFWSRARSVLTRVKSKDTATSLSRPHCLTHRHQLTMPLPPRRDSSSELRPPRSRHKRTRTRCSTSCCDRSSPGTSSSPPSPPPREVDLAPEKQRQQHLLSRLLVIELSLAQAGASSPPPPSPAAPPAAVARHRTPFSAGRRELDADAMPPDMCCTSWWPAAEATSEVTLANALQVFDRMPDRETRG